MKRSSSSSGDEVLVQVAGRRFAVRAAALVAVVVLALMVLVAVVVVHQQSAAADSLLRSTARSADDVGDPPPGAWLAMTRGTRTVTSPGLPAEVAATLPSMRAAATRKVRLRSLAVDDGRHYEVATLARAHDTVQVVLDLTAQRMQRQRLLRAMGAAAGLGLLLAAALGALLGRRAVRPLAEALALQRTFVADASHELRTPLTLLSTRAQVLESGLQSTDAPDQLRRDAAGVVDDVRRLAEVVEDLLVAADPGDQQPTGRIDVAALAGTALQTASAHAERAGISLQAEYDVAATEGRCLVVGAEAALRRALLALIDNAVDHTPAGGVVTVSVDLDRRDVRVTVADTGPGIAPQDRHDVMRRFHSGGHRSGRRHYGLGLALTHDVANRLGGQLRILPSTEGATFQLSLPALDGDTAGGGRAPRRF